jgi:hypothetical protein
LRGRVEIARQQAKSVEVGPHRHRLPLAGWALSRHQP